VLRNLLGLLAALVLVFPGSAALAEPSVAASPVAAHAAEMPPPGDCGGRIGLYSWTGQPQHAWIVRVTGVDLSSLVPGGAGRAWMVFHDSDAAESRDVFFDRDHPLNITAGVNGPSVTVAISITDNDGRTTYCAENITKRHAP